jgi:hypothetical protein
VFALADAGKLEQLLLRAGFAGVVVTRVNSERRLASAEGGMRMIQDSFGFYRAPIDDQPVDVQAAAWAEVEQALRRLEGADGLVAPDEQLVGSGFVWRRV